MNFSNDQIKIEYLVLCSYYIIYSPIFARKTIDTQMAAEIPPPVFMFYSKSANAAPGRGAHETIHDAQCAKYGELAQIVGWRKMLSNFYTRDAPGHPLFELDGRQWRSVEHYFQAWKFAIVDPDYFNLFALNSGSQLALGDGLAARKAGRAVKLSAEAIADWDARKAAVMARAHRAKYTQNPDCARVLVLTDGAVLTHKASFRAAIEHEQGLMRLRDELVRG